MLRRGPVSQIRARFVAPVLLRHAAFSRACWVQFSFGSFDRIGCECFALMGQLSSVESALKRSDKLRQLS